MSRESKQLAPLVFIGAPPLRPYDSSIEIAVLEPLAPRALAPRDGSNDCGPNR